MDVETLYAIVEICNASEKLRAANPRAATPSELEEMGLNFQMTQDDPYCTCGGDPILGDVFLTRTGHMDADWMCPLNWLMRSREVH